MTCSHELAAPPRASVTYEVRIHHADGSWRWLQVISTNLLEDPAVNGIVSNARDITVAREQQEMLRHQASRPTHPARQPGTVHRTNPTPQSPPETSPSRWRSCSSTSTTSRPSTTPSATTSAMPCSSGVADRNCRPAYRRHRRTSWRRRIRNPAPARHRRRREKPSPNRVIWPHSAPPSPPPDTSSSPRQASDWPWTSSDDPGGPALAPTPPCTPRNAAARHLRPLPDRTPA